MFRCGHHGSQAARLDDPAAVIDANTPIRTVLRSLCFSRDRDERGTETVVLNGGDWAGVWMQRVYFDGLHQLGCCGTQVPFNIFTPQILDDSGAKLSKTIYLTRGAYADVPSAWISIQAFEDRFGTGGLDMLWDEISGWVRSPEKFFRNYTVRYLEHAFGQMSGPQPATVASPASVRRHAARSRILLRYPRAGHRATTPVARDRPAAMHSGCVPAAQERSRPARSGGSSTATTPPACRSASKPPTRLSSLDLPAWACLWGIIQRRLRHGGGQHDAVGVYDRITWNCIRYIAGYRKQMAPRVCQLIVGHAGDAQVVVLRSRHAAAIPRGRRRAGICRCPGRRGMPLDAKRC